jgi:apolipoprotein N-acyltransferase
MFEVVGFGLGHSVVLAVYLGAYPAVFAALLPHLFRSRLPLAWGAAWRLAGEERGATVRVAAVQPAILREERATRDGERATLRRLEALTREAAARSPALIVWPETAVRGVTGFESSFEWLQGLSDGADTTLLVGVSQFEKFPSADAPDGTGFRARQMNLAVAFRPHAAEPDVYRKALLVPFAEYLPAPSFPWPAWLVGKTFDVVPGDGPGLFRLADGTPLAPLICWENLFSGFVRRSAAGGARLLVQLTNDNWFGRTAAPLQLRGRRRGRRGRARPRRDAVRARRLGFRRRGGGSGRSRRP